MEQIFIVNANPASEHTVINESDKIHIITDDKEFTLSFAGNDIVIKEVSGDNIEVIRYGSNKIRVI